MKIKAYSEAQKYLESLIPNAYNKRYKSLRLERIEHLLDLINNPHRSFKSVHVGGTSGKGSTVYLISRILTEAGYKTGLHISPHLQKINERMQINHQSIADEELIQLVNWVAPYAQKVGKSNPFGAPSYFEVLVALSFEYFKRKHVDIAVVEVGLGGALDATNVIHPLASIITNVDLDHTEILGDTIERIAADKSGIIKNKIDVVTAAKQKTVIEIIQKKCIEKNASLLIINKDINYQIRQSTLEGSLFDLQTKNHHYHNLKLSLIGRHQAANAACAVAAVESLVKFGFIIHEKHIRGAFANAFFPGRMEIIRKKPMIILDGAHNPTKMQALADTLQELFHQKVIAVVGFKKKKDIESMIKILLPITKKFVLTKFTTAVDTGIDLSVAPGEIYETIKKIDCDVTCEIIAHCRKAVNQAQHEAHPDDVVCVTGSLYLVGEVRSYLN